MSQFIPMFGGRSTKCKVSECRDSVTSTEESEDMQKDASLDDRGQDQLRRRK